MPRELSAQGPPRIRISTAGDWHSAAIDVRLPGGAVSVSAFHDDGGETSSWLSFVGPRGGSRGTVAFSTADATQLENAIRARSVFAQSKHPFELVDLYGYRVRVTGPHVGYSAIGVTNTRGRLLHTIEGHISVFGDLAAALRFTRSHVAARAR